jgi:glycosyltransferase involved in cell wall biosynthesis
VRDTVNHIAPAVQPATDAAFDFRLPRWNAIAHADFRLSEDCLMKRPRYVAFVGDATDPATFSGFPYHLVKSGQSLGVITGGLPLGHTVRFKSARVIWNAVQLLTTGKYGGHQYTEGAMRALWAPVSEQISGSDLINIFQLYPEALWGRPDVRKWFYIDATLDQLFVDYGTAKNYPRSFVADIISRERAGYLRAEAVVCHSHWAAQSVVRDYGVSPAKVHVVLPGANIDEEAFSRWRPKKRGAADGLALVFVGREWRRKGLDRLLAAMQIAAKTNPAIRLKVVGCQESDLPAEYRGVNRVDWVGRIDKQVDLPAFLDSIAQADIGCLLSRAECGGISLREFGALGLGMLAPDVGGSPEHCPAGAAILVKPAAEPAEIARLLLDLASNPKRVASLKRAAKKQSADMLWSASLRKLDKILSI